MTLPNFIIAGTARSGTTSLYYYLKQHPEISFPEKKEPKYFSSTGIHFPHNGPGDDTVDNAVVKYIDEYKKLFNGLPDVKRIGEASSDYLYYHKVTAPEIKKDCGDIPIIIVLRNPVDRAYSAYNNLLRDNREYLSFREASEDEEQRLKKNWDWMWAYKRGGLYAEQVQTYMETFSSVMVILFDELTQDTQNTLARIYKFLGVEESFQADTSARYSYSGKARNPVVAFLSRRDNKLAFGIRRLIMSIVPRKLLEKIAGKTLHKQQMLDSDQEYLNKYFSNDILKLEKILKIDLSKWK